MGVEYVVPTLTVWCTREPLDGIGSEMFQVHGDINIKLVGGWDRSILLMGGMGSHMCGSFSSRARGQTKLAGGLQGLTIIEAQSGHVLARKTNRDVEGGVRVNDCGHLATKIGVAAEILIKSIYRTMGELELVLINDKIVNIVLLGVIVKNIVHGALCTTGAPFIAKRV
jgi:hypothetical protein